jgi:hypothetical protein
VAVWGGAGEGSFVVWKHARFEVLDMNADALLMSRGNCKYCRGHFQCNQLELDDLSTQRGKSISCIDFTSEPRNGHIRRRRDMGCAL